MKVLLVSYNKESIPIAVKPLGLAYIAHALEQSGHTQKLLDLRFKDNVGEVLIKQIEEFEPELIGISIRNIDTSCFLEPTFYIPEAKSIVDMIRSYSKEIPIVLGGAGFSLMAKEIYEFCEGADYGIIGEGEVAYDKLIKAIENNSSLEDVPSLIYRENGEIKNNKREYLDKITRTDLCDFFDREYYAEDFDSTTNRTNTEGILTKRGCVFGCNFCGTPNFDGRKMRCYDVVSIVDNMESIVKKSKKEVIFEIVDNIINYPVWHLEELCKEMIKRDCGFKWMGIATPELIDDNLAKLMKESGCVSIEFGIESFSNKILKNFSKSFTKEEAIRGFEICHKYGIQTLCDIMLCGPGENFETIKETFETIDLVNPHFTLFNYGIRIFPDTGLCDRAKKEGQIKEDENLLAPKFYFSKEIELEALLYIEEKLRKNAKRFYLCKDVFRYPLEECIKKSTQIWKDIEDKYF